MDERTLDMMRGEGVVEVVIDDYGYTGEGYVRLEDGWLSVPGALPGERVVVRIQPDEGRSRRLFGSVVEVLEPSGERRDPLCERDDVCRGCQLRHMKIGEELRFRVRTVCEVIEKYADVPADEQPEIEIITPQPIARGDAFRMRSTLTYRRTEVGFELGLVSPVRPTLVPMDVCPALTTPVRRLVGTLEEALGALDELFCDADDVRTGEGDGGGRTTGEAALRAVRVASPVIGRGLVDIELVETEEDDLLERAVARGPLARLVERLEIDLPEEVGLAVSHGRDRAHLAGPKRIRLPLAGLKLEVGYDDWFPATLAPAEAIYGRLPDLLELEEDDSFLDIGSGIGTISLLAAERVDRVVGVDRNRQSISTAELNAVANGATNVEFVVGGWENALRQLTLQDASFGVATINPMREPLGKRPLTYLRALGVERLVYLGPSPASAARDIGELRRLGWRLEMLAAANIHPATYHTMLVARLSRTADGPAADSRAESSRPEPAAASRQKAQ